MNHFVNQIAKIDMSPRIAILKDKTLVKERFVSMEQAKIITESYRANENKPISSKRALSFKASCEFIEININKNELIVGNRTKAPRDGVVFPEGGITWLKNEIDDLSVRKQDPFTVRPEDREYFINELSTFWDGMTLEDEIEREAGEEIYLLKTVAKINQTDHAQGHICPNSIDWLTKGPIGIREDASNRAAACKDSEKRLFYENVCITMDGAIAFMIRYSDLAGQMALGESDENKETLLKISEVCRSLSQRPATGFHEALQSVWFLFVLLHMESNASSFSLGRMDQILLPYYKEDLLNGKIDLQDALELTDALWLKFNQIVYLRNDTGARYFAGFPIGFNIAVGGQLADGTDAVNELSYLFLRAQEHIRLPQPNLSVRLYKNSPHLLLQRVTQVISLGGGMPQIFNDESIIPALIRQGVSYSDAMDYAIVGCVELTTQGNALGWSDAAMFNMVKVLELTINDGKSILDGKQIGLKTGYLFSFHSFDEFESSLQKQVDHFIDRMMPVTRTVDRIHARIMPSAFLSGVIDDCLENGMDVTAGGAKYNFSGIQLIQVANIADCLAALKSLVFDSRTIDTRELLNALYDNFKNSEIMRQKLLNWAPKYGNDVEWVDQIASKWHLYFAKRLEEFTNARGGRTQTGLYTVSAHVPMGINVSATPDGRLAGTPLADGGVSAVYGRDMQGPTALLRSVGALDMDYGSNGSLLNMKFLPEFFETQDGIEMFCALIKTIVRLKINHCQINVVRKEDLIAAQDNPEQFLGLTIRVAGYTAFFIELDSDLQNEIINRTAFGGENG